MEIAPIKVLLQWPQDERKSQAPWSAPPAGSQSPCTTVPFCAVFYPLAGDILTSNQPQSDDSKLRLTLCPVTSPDVLQGSGGPMLPHVPPPQAAGSGERQPLPPCRSPWLLEQTQLELNIALLGKLLLVREPARRQGSLRADFPSEASPSREFTGLAGSVFAVCMGFFFLVFFWGGTHQFYENFHKIKRLTA